VSLCDGNNEIKISRYPAANLFVMRFIMQRIARANIDIFSSRVIVAVSSISLEFYGKCDSLYLAYFGNRPPTLAKHLTFSHERRIISTFVASPLIIYARIFRCARATGELYFVWLKSTKVLMLRRLYRCTQLRRLIVLATRLATVAEENLRGCQRERSIQEREKNARAISPFIAFLSETDNIAYR